MGFVVVIVSLSPATDLRFSMDQFTRNPVFVFEIVSHYSGKTCDCAVTSSRVFGASVSFFYIRRIRYHVQ